MATMYVVEDKITKELDFYNSLKYAKIAYDSLTSEASLLKLTTDYDGNDNYECLEEK